MKVEDRTVKKEVITTEAATQRGIPYSPAIKAGGLLYISGQTGSHPVTREFSPDIKEQTRIALENVKELAELGGCTLEDGLSMTIHMTDMMNEFQQMNEVFREFFPVNPPSRTTVGVSHLARKGVKIEISMIAQVL